MKPIILILVILLAFLQTNGTNYYLSSSSGNDLLDGKTVNTAWQTISKLKMVLNILQPGDSVLFKCNDTFTGQLILSRSGNASKNIYFGSYGSGKKPVISGTATVTNWTQTKTNIWEATCTDCGSLVTNFFINGVPQQIGRWPNVTDPNKGYLSYESHSGTTQITDNQLTGGIDWTGAEAVVRRVRWILDRLTIKSHIGNTLQFTTNVAYEFQDGFGYFIQNDPKTLDQQGEWYYNPANKKFSLYSETDPNTLITKATEQDNLIKLNAVSYNTVENLQFNGSGKLTMDVENCNRLTISNNEFIYSGENAVNFNNSNNINFESNLINRTNNNAFNLSGCKNFVIRNNIIKNTALIAGRGLGGDGQYNAAQLGGTNMLVEYNTIDSVGYIGMDFRGDTMTIKNNVISNYCMTKDDGGGLYTWSNGSINYSRKLINNILLNAIGAPEGTGGKDVAAEGIYIDDRSANVDIIGNSVYQCGNSGIYIHNANHINIHMNTVYNNKTQLRMTHDNISPTDPITNCVVDSNAFVARNADQLVASFETIDNGFSKMGAFDYNSYARPLDDDLTIQINGYTSTLNNWYSTYLKDQHSTRSPIAFEQQKILEVISSNFFNNSDFESNLNSWTSSSTYNNSRITLAAGEGDSGNSLKASFTSSSAKSGSYMFVVSNNFEMTKGKSYRLRFSAKSSIPNTSIKMVPRKIGATNEVANEKSFLLGTTYSDFETLVIPLMDEPLSTIEFEIPEFHGSVWFDNMEIVEVSVENTNTDDYIRFEYNASKNDKSISILDNYVDVKGNPVSENIALKPYSSIILFKKLSTSIGYYPETTRSDIWLFPNPATNYITARSNDEIQSVCLYNINGEVLKSFQVPLTKEFIISNLPTSGLYIVQIKTKNSTEYKKVLIQN